MIITILRKKTLMPQCVEKEEGGDLREPRKPLGGWASSSGGGEEGNFQKRLGDWLPRELGAGGRRGGSQVLSQ